MPASHLRGALVALALAVVGAFGSHAVPTRAPATTGRPAAPVVDAPASIPHDCRTPAGDALTRWLAALPPGTTARLAPRACYALDTGVVLRHLHHLTIDGAGARLEAVTRRTGTGRELLDVEGGSDITVEHLQLKGVLSFVGPYTTAFHSPDEWQHGIGFHGTQTALVRDVQVGFVLGDFVEAAPDTTDHHHWIPTRDLTVTGSQFFGAGRQGFGITDAIGVTITHDWIGRVAQNAIDLEPGADQGHALDVTIADDTFGAYRYAAIANKGAGAPGHVGAVSVLDDTVTAMPTTCLPFLLVGSPGGVMRSGYRVVGNRILTYQQAIVLSGVAGATVTGNTVRSTAGTGGCREDYGVVLDRVHGATVRDNDFANVHAVLHVSGGTTALAAAANRQAAQR